MIPGALDSILRTGPCNVQRSVDGSLYKIDHFQGGRFGARASPAETLLASGDLAPHMQAMTSSENPRAEASDHAAAIARWDDEGGASRPAPRKNDAGVWKEHRRTDETARGSTVAPSFPNRSRFL
jgi:hypothetical protein